MSCTDIPFNDSSVIIIYHLLAISNGLITCLVSVLYYHLPVDADNQYRSAGGITTYRNGPKRTGTDRNGLSWIPKRTFWVPKRTLVDTETDRDGPERTKTDRNGPKRTFVDTETDFLGTETDFLGTEMDFLGTETDFSGHRNGLFGYKIVIRGA